MKRELALKLLDRVMQWDSERAGQELEWLSLMSRMKYDGYRGFVPGLRFIESLADWLQQFRPDERQAAYDFLRRHLVYISGPEIEQLVELFYPETVRRRLIRAFADQAHIPVYRVWARHDTIRRYEVLLRRTLFIGLSDGARVDVFRRANTGVISNEQVVVAPHITSEKWRDLLNKLRKDTGDSSARFAFVYVFDDFTGSGRTLLRKDDDGQWTGKLQRLWTEMQKIRETHLCKNWTLCVHHYVSSSQARRSIEETQERARRERKEEWFQNVEFSYGLELSENLPVKKSCDQKFLTLVVKYYDKAIESEHTGKNIGFGYYDCGLPLVLEHNTPNNSVALLWAETDGADGQHAMRPLFRRRQRHL